MFCQSWDREFQTTVKVLKAYPSHRWEYRPHEKSMTTRELAWLFVREEGVMEMTVKGKIDFGATPPPMPATFDEILAAYQAAHTKHLEMIKNMSDADWNSLIAFPAGPGKMMDIRKADVCWTMMCDMIHHRGQLSVYIRLAGGKIPSIYGPTADEPWM